MHDTLLEILTDPAGSGPLTLAAARRDQGGAVVEGELLSRNGTTYAITDYVPRLSVGSDPEQTQTRRSFAFKWKQQHSYGSEGMVEQSRRWIATRYGFSSIGEMTNYLSRR